MQAECQVRELESQALRQRLRDLEDQLFKARGLQPSSANQFIQTDPIPLEELLHLQSEVMTPMSPLSVTDCERPAITLMISAQSLKESERGFNNRRSARSSNRRQSRKDSGTSPLNVDT